MQHEIIKRLTTKLGITESQAQQAITVISEYIGEKYPMMKGQIRNFLGEHGTGGAEDKPQVGGINLTGLG
jgi:hypothetical protein